jgi:hypothetical protein
MRKNNPLAAYAALVSGFALRVTAALKYFRRDIKGLFYASMGKAQKRIFIFCNIFLSAYITFFVYIAHFDMIFAARSWTIMVFFVSIFIFVLVYNAIIFVCSGYGSAAIIVSGKKEKINIETAALFGGLCWIILLLSLAASFPGAKSPDTEDQWAQVHSFNFSNWHPAIHTFMIWIVTRVADHYAFVVFVQITLFSIGVGYLIAVMESWGFKKTHLLIAGLFIILNPYTMNIMMYPWKDLALTVLITYTTIMAVNIYYSDGSWFLKYRNIILFALTAGITSVVRHNGFFFTLPLCILVALLYSKKTLKALVSVVLVALVVFLVKVPLYRALHVTTNPSQTYIESVGIPMTILGDTMVKNPQRLPPEAKEFLNKIATDEEWREKYSPGNYNSIKFIFPASEVVETVAPEKLLGWVLQTCVSASYEAFHAFCDVTDIVWDIFKGGNLFPRWPSANNIIGKTFYNFFVGYTGLCLALPVISSLFTNIGLLMLLLLLAGIFSLSRNGVSALLLVVPSVCYNLGTMMLLCGSDVRFFHFNVVITMPLLFVLLAKQGNRRQP